MFGFRIKTLIESLQYQLLLRVFLFLPMTVYQRLTSFTNSTGFKFKPDHRKYIGIEVSKVWQEHGGTREQLDCIQQTEDTGTWMVLDYPASFQEEIDRVIKGVFERITAPKKPKITNEKPLIKDPARPISYASDPPKKRTRKPIQSKPHFSGKLLSKNKSGTP